jgi:hypothetical protein
LSFCSTRYHHRQQMGISPGLYSPVSKLHFMPERRLQTHLFFEALLGAANATHSSWLTKVRYTSVLHFQRTGCSNDTGGDPAEA